MHIHVDRLESDNKATRGKLYVDGQFVCYTLEDQYRDGEKVHGETRIPDGAYRIELYPHGTKFHPRYLNDYGADWHKGMLHVCDVPGFDGVLIHKGNYHTDTEGCLLVGMTKATGKGKLDKNGNSQIAVGASGEAYKCFYPKVRDALLRGETVTIEYSNSDVAARNSTSSREGEVKSSSGVVAVATGIAGVALAAGAAADLVGVDESGAGDVAVDAGLAPATPAAPDTPAAPTPSQAPATGTAGASVASPAPAARGESSVLEISLVVLGVVVVLFAAYLGYRRWKEWRRR